MKGHASCSLQTPTIPRRGIGKQRPPKFQLEAVLLRRRGIALEGASFSPFLDERFAGWVISFLETSDSLNSVKSFPRSLIRKIFFPPFFHIDVVLLKRSERHDFFLR